MSQGSRAGQNPSLLSFLILLNNVVKSNGVWVVLLLKTHTAVQDGTRQFTVSIFPPVGIADSSLYYFGCPVAIKSVREKYLPFKKKQLLGRVYSKSEVTHLNCL